MLASSTPVRFGPEFQTGITLIDDQHRVLFYLIDRVDEYLRGECEDVTGCSQTLQDLIHYAIYHLTFEEKLVARLGYQDQIRVHALEHDQFRRTVERYRDAGERGRPSQEIADLQAYLKDWLVRHILHGDVPLFRRIRQESPEVVR